MDNFDYKIIKWRLRIEVFLTSVFFSLQFLQYEINFKE